MAPHVRPCPPGYSLPCIQQHAAVQCLWYLQQASGCGGCLVSLSIALMPWCGVGTMMLARQGRDQMGSTCWLKVSSMQGQQRFKRGNSSLHVVYALFLSAVLGT